MAHYLDSPLAEQDIESIGDYIALDNPLRALTFIAEAQPMRQDRSLAQSISRPPGAGR